MFKRKFVALLCFFTIDQISCVNYDVNVVGLLGVENTVPLISTIITDALIQGDVRVNFINSRPQNSNSPIVGKFLNDIPFGINALGMQDPSIAPISLLTDVIGYADQAIYKSVPNSHIKFAYSMIETDAVPEWIVKAINSSFDAVIVPHQCLVDIYQKSGVEVPVFVISLPIYLETILSRQLKQARSTPFVFGISAGFCERKNHKLLLWAFSRAFKNNKNVKLKIHGGWGDSLQISRLIKKLKLKNVNVIEKTLDRNNYINFLSSCDCYVFPSKGEGFSLTPREALALGIPCILSNHTVHEDLTHLGSVIAVDAQIKESAQDYTAIMGEVCGNYHQGTVHDWKIALEKMYNNYEYYLSRNEEGREYTKRYLIQNLASSYRTLIKPLKVTLVDPNIEGSANKILSTGELITTSPTLYRKYNDIYSFD